MSPLDLIIVDPWGVVVVLFLLVILEWAAPKTQKPNK